MAPSPTLTWTLQNGNGKKKTVEKKILGPLRKNGGPNPVSLLNVGVYLGAPWGLHIDQGSEPATEPEGHGNRSSDTVDKPASSI